MLKSKLPAFIIGIVTVILIFVLGFALGGRQKTPEKVANTMPVETSQKQQPSPSILAAPQPEVVSADAVEEPVVAPAATEETQASSIEPEFQKGMIYVAWTQDGYSNANSVKSMEQMKSIGVDWAGLVTTWYQDQYNSTQISPITDKTPSDQSLAFSIQKLHELKLKVMLKPHLDIVRGEGKWRGDIVLDTPEDRQKWEENYTKFIMHYAEIAAKENVELFCIGTELTQLTLGQPQYWRDLIKQVRRIYKGTLTYAANWHEEFNKIEFWDALDYAGIDPYFPLVTTNNPKVEELKSAWEYWLNSIDEWQAKVKKPVILAEIGYKSSSDATDEPWQHVGVGKLDLELQANCYKALLEVFWNKPWFYGAYWWYWGVHPSMGGAQNKGFTPQNKPAQEVIKEWYLNKAVSEKRIEDLPSKEEETMVDSSKADSGDPAGMQDPLDEEHLNFGPTRTQDAEKQEKKE